MFFVRETQCVYCDWSTEFFIKVIVYINFSVRYLDLDYFLVYDMKVLKNKCRECYYIL